VHQDGKGNNLNFDPKELIWPRKGIMKEANFYGYTTKWGYKIIVDRISEKSKFDLQLQDMDYSRQECKNFFQSLWHKWILRKVSTMIWLIFQGGLLLGAWRAKL
jgi:hypothetical protein